METRARYAIIGLFTLAVVAAAFVFVYWVTEFGVSKQRIALDVIFSDSVSGLSVGAAVQFNGIPVGQVTGISIHPNDPRKVDVHTKIDATAPLRADTLARLEYQGLTGSASIGLAGGDPRAAELKPRDDGVLELNGSRSDFQELMETARSVATRADELLARLDKVVGDNQASVNKIVKNAESFTSALGDNSAGLNRFLSQVGDSGKAALDEVHDAASSIRNLANSLDGRIAEVSNGLIRFTGAGLQQYQDLAVEARRTLSELNRTLQSIQRNPQQFLTGPRAAMPQYGGK